MNLVFMGTSEFAIPSLLRMRDEFQVTAVVTQPDRPRGRGHKLEPTPIKSAAIEAGLPVYQFESIKDSGAEAVLSELKPDIIVVVSYGQIIPASILDLPPWGCINVHASLLPRYRGAAPIQRSIMAGETLTGVTTMFMDKGLDTGDILMQRATEITDDMDYGSLQNRLAEIGADLLAETIGSVAQGTIQRTPQDNEAATYAAMINKDDEFIDWNRPATQIRDQIRALSPKPGSYTTFMGKKIKIYKSRVAPSVEQFEAGTFVGDTAAGFLIQTGQNCLEVLEVQKEGKKQISASEFLKGVRLQPGDRFGS